jgi:hypothetical protein
MTSGTRLACVLLVLLGVIAMGAASASAEPPVFPEYDGGMTFPDIHDSSAPEEYSWEMNLSSEQELVSIDDQHAEVYYTEGHYPAFGISAEPAHDADGSAVPTSIAVSAGDVITLIVHYRAGNPAAGGVPFVYPITGGVGWEGGFRTITIVMPNTEKELQEEREKKEREERDAAQAAAKHCLVPRLNGRSLKAAKKLLRAADCRLGEAKKRKGATAKAGEVVIQNPRPGRALAPQSSVDLTLGR